MIPIISIPISRKVVATFIVTGILALLRSASVIEPPAELTAWIVVGGGLLAGAIVGEGTKYVNYFLRKRGLPAVVEDKP